MTIRYLTCIFILLAAIAKAQCPMPDNQSAGTLDTCFRVGPEVTGHVFDMKLQSDGKIVAIVFKPADSEIVRLHTDGARDTTFRSPYDGRSGPLDILVQADDKIIVSGAFNTLGGRPIRSIARLNPDGNVDTTFYNGDGFGGDFPHDLAGPSNLTGLPDGKIMAGGSFKKYDGVARRGLVRLHPDGRLDTTFRVGTGFDGAVQAVALQPDGKLLVAGDYTSYNGRPAEDIVRLHTDGSLDTSFNAGTGLQYTFQLGRPYINSIRFVSDSTILMAGYFSGYNGDSCQNMARVFWDGTIDTTFRAQLGINSVISDVLVKPNGRLLVGGRFSRFNADTVNRIVQLLPNGEMDQTIDFGQGFIGDSLLDYSNVMKFVRLDDGKVLAGGDFKTYNQQAGHAIARLFVEDITVSVKKLVAASFQIYPNPANSVVTVAMQEAIVRISLISTDGKSIPIQLNQNSFSVAGITPGIYTAVIQTKTGKATRVRLAVSK